MTKQIAIVVSLLAITSTLYAADSRTATKFLRAYVDTLCAEKSGDHAKALETITPFATIDGREMHATAADATYGQYGDASIQASWALVTNTWAEPRMRFAVGKRERKKQSASCVNASDRTSRMVRTTDNRRSTAVLH